MAVKRGATVRILMSGGYFQTISGMKRECDKINKRCGSFSCVFDWRHGHPQKGSSHEKMWMVREGSELTAFIGSMDIADSRWDSAAHEAEDSLLWRKQPKENWAHFAWHDAMYQIRGTAAEDIMKTFLARWNDPAPPDRLM